MKALSTLVFKNDFDIVNVWQKATEFRVKSYFHKRKIMMNKFR